MKSFKRKCLASALSAAMVFGTAIAPYTPIVVIAEEETAPEIGAYHAYLTMQTGSWSYRNPYDGDPNAEDLHQITGWDGNNEKIKMPGTLIDAEITHDGKYTVGVTGLEFTEDEFANSDGTYRILGVSTDITWEEQLEGVSLTIESVCIGGEEISFEQLDQESDYIYFTVQNYWSGLSMGPYDATSSDIYITFNISGLEQPCGENVTYMLLPNGNKSDDGHSMYDLVISGEGAMEDYSISENVPWYNYMYNIENVKVGEGVTSISGCAFNEYNSLKTVTLPSTLDMIPDDAFYGCSALECVTLTEGLTKIGSNAFCDCRALTSIHIPNTVTEVGKSAFASCKSLSEVSISNALTVIRENTFYNCSALTEIDIPNGIKMIEPEAFYYCLNLEKITGGESVEYIGNHAFSYTEWMKQGKKVKQDGAWGVKLGKTLAIAEEAGDFSTGGSNCVDGCYYRELPDGTLMLTKSASVESGASDKYIGLPQIEGKSFTIIGPWAYEGMSGGDYLPNNYNVPEGIEYIAAYAYTYSNGMQEVTMPKSLIGLGEYAFYASFGQLKKVNLNEGLKWVGSYAFLNNFMTEVKIPASVESIGYHAFGYNEVLNDETEEYVETKTDGFTIYGYSGTAAETYALENGFAFVPMDVDVSYDEEAFPDGTPQINVQNMTDNEDDAQKLNEKGITDYRLYDITVTLNGELVQPKQAVTVSIKVPEDVNADACKVYRLENDGTLTDMNAVNKDGFMVFETDHFSLYVLTEQSPSKDISYGDVNNDGKVNAKDVVLIKRFAANWNVELDNAAADVNCDGKVNAKDVVLVKRYAADWDVKLGK